MRNGVDGILHGTLITPNVEQACSAYRTQLSMTVTAGGALAGVDAELLGRRDLAGTRVAWLASSGGHEVLRVVADPQCVPGNTVPRYGWFALEFRVSNVDATCARLRSPFRVLGAPANLDFSDAIRAAQVLGPCGEVLYLTEIKRPVPPFDLPVDDGGAPFPFVAVVGTPDRASTRDAWAALLGNRGWEFDTRISLLSRALGRPMGNRYHVAVVPMRARCLVEIDEVIDPRVGPAVEGGWHSICVRIPVVNDALLQEVGWRVIRCGSRRALIGRAGEHVELATAGEAA